MSHIHLSLAPDTPNDKLIVLAKYCLARAGVTSPEIALQKANGTIKRRLRQATAPDVTFPDAELEQIWQDVASWGTHWWIQVAPILDALLERDAHTDDTHDAWTRVAHMLDLAGHMFISHLTGIAPSLRHDDMAFFDDETLLPPHLHNVIGQAARVGVQGYQRRILHKAAPNPLSLAEEMAARFAQRSAGALLRPLVSNIQARIASQLVHQERQALRTRVPQAIRQRMAPRTLARLLAQDIGNWQRDWERVARTELQNAAHHGAIESLIIQHPSNQVLQPDGSTAPSATPVTPTVMVWRQPAATACDHCLRLYQKPDGTPRLYRLADVLSAPPNYGVPAAQWQQQVGPTHPNCVCSQWMEYMPAMAGLFAGMRKARPLHSRTDWRGLQVSIEYGPGDVKHGVAPDGTPWQTLMRYPYGYIRMTEGMDGEQVDVFLGNDRSAPMVYCITARTPPDFRYNDEDKCFLGFSSVEAARDAFLAHYDDPRFLGHITPMPFAEFSRKVLATKDTPKLLRSRT